MKGWAWLGLLGILVAVGHTVSAYHLTMNVGQSMLGHLYACRTLTPRETLTLGEVVYFMPPSRVIAQIRRVAPDADLHLGWLKAVAALPGDEVCWEEGFVLVNQEIRGALPLLKDYALEPQRACVQVGADEVLVLGTAERSFDGRYSGLLGREELRDVCTVLF